MEAIDKWMVVTSGHVLEGNEKSKVVVALKQKLRLSDIDPEVLLNGETKVLCKDLEQGSAYKYKQVLQSIGIDANLRPMPKTIPVDLAANLSLTPLPPEQTLSSDVDNSADSDVVGRVVALGEMQCPKCNSVQARSIECRVCGLIVDRYRPVAEKQRQAVTRARQERYTALLMALGVMVFLLVLVKLFSSPDSLPIGTSDKAIAQIEALSKSLNHQAIPFARLRHLVKAGNYREVEEAIYNLHYQTTLDISWEDKYLEVIYGMTRNHGFSLNDMDSWVERSGSAIAYMARASYYLTEAGKVIPPKNNWS